MKKYGSWVKFKFDCDCSSRRQTTRQSQRCCQLQQHKMGQRTLRAISDGPEAYNTLKVSAATEYYLRSRLESIFLPSQYEPKSKICNKRSIRWGDLLRLDVILGTLFPGSTQWLGRSFRSPLSPNFALRSRRNQNSERFVDLELLNCCRPEKKKIFWISD